MNEKEAAAEKRIAAAAAAATKKAAEDQEAAIRNGAGSGSIAGAPTAAVRPGVPESVPGSIHPEPVQPPFPPSSTATASDGGDPRLLSVPHHEDAGKAMKERTDELYTGPLSGSPQALDGSGNLREDLREGQREDQRGIDAPLTAGGAILGETFVDAPPGRVGEKRTVSVSVDGITEIRGAYDVSADPGVTAYNRRRAVDEAEAEARKKVPRPAVVRAIGETALVFSSSPTDETVQFEGRFYTIKGNAETALPAAVADFVVGPDQANSGALGGRGVRRVFPQGHARFAENETIIEDSRRTAERFQARGRA